MVILRTAYLSRKYCFEQQLTAVWFFRFLRFFRTLDRIGRSQRLITAVLFSLMAMDTQKFDSPWNQRSGQLESLCMPIRGVSGITCQEK